MRKRILVYLNLGIQLSEPLWAASGQPSVIETVEKYSTDDWKKCFSDIEQITREIVNIDNDLE